MLKKTKNLREDADFSPSSSERSSNIISSRSDDGSESNNSTGSCNHDVHQHRKFKSQNISNKNVQIKRPKRKRLQLQTFITDSSDGEQTVLSKNRIKKKKKNDDDAYKPPMYARIRTRTRKLKDLSSPSSGNSDEESSNEAFDSSSDKGVNKLSKEKSKKLQKNSVHSKIESSSEVTDEPSSRITKNSSGTETDSDTDFQKGNGCQRKSRIPILHSDSEEEFNEKDDVGRLSTTTSDDEAGDITSDDCSLPCSTSDSVLEKLKEQREDELEREDVILEKIRRQEMAKRMKAKLDLVHETKFRQIWAKPDFGSEGKFYDGWQEGFLKFKREFARLPIQLLHCKSLGLTNTIGDPTRTNSLRVTTPVRITRSRTHNNQNLLLSDKLREHAPSPNTILQNFFERVVSGDDGRIDSDSMGSGKKFGSEGFPAFGTLRTHTGLTPTPSVAPSMLASDDSDSDSIASRRSPASDSAPLARRKSVATQLIKKFRRKYSTLNVGWLNRPRTVVPNDSTPKLLPTPGLDPTKPVDLRSLSTFFRKDTVKANAHIFDELLQNNGYNVFSTSLMQSRTRKEAKQLLDEETIKAVFGDIPRKTQGPLIAPKRLIKNKNVNLIKLKSEIKLKETSQTPPASSVASDDREDDLDGVSNENVNLTLPFQRNEIFAAGLAHHHHARKQRRKNKINKSSGFDYLRKKKKPISKLLDDESTSSLKKKQVVRRAALWPEDARDVAGEVRSWVVNKHLGETVLHKAARNNYHDAIIYCLEHPDYDVNVRDNAGYTPLHEACNRGHLAVAQALLAHGASVNTAGHGGVRPLHEAMENSRAELVRLLLSYGADPSLCTYSGQRPADLATDALCLHLLHLHLADLAGLQGSAACHLPGPASFMDAKLQGYNIFLDVPSYRDSISKNQRTSVSVSCIEFGTKETVHPVIKTEPGTSNSNLSIRPDDEESALQSAAYTSQNEDGFIFEESSNELPDIYMLRNTTQRYVLLDDVLRCLKLESMAEVVLRVSAEGTGGTVESRSVSGTQLLTHYTRLTPGGHTALPDLRQQTLQLLHYSAPLRRVLDVQDTLVL